MWPFSLFWGWTNDPTVVVTSFPVRIMDGSRSRYGVDDASRSRYGVADASTSRLEVD
jgi:hypothetical protein